MSTPDLSDLRGCKVVFSGFHAPKLGVVETFTNAVMTIDDAGVITVIEPDGDLTGAIHLPEDWLLIPGLVDLHVHAPQYAQLGAALDEPLEDWLQKYTFPLEARFEDLSYADEVYSTLIEDMLAIGTTTALHFATIHVPATKRLAEICLAKGQRALVGKVAMDDPELCPPYYRDASPEEAIEGTREVIDFIRGLPNNDGMVHPVITPRFIPSCTDACLEGLGALAKATGAHVQSHVSESDWQHGFVQDRCGCSDAEAFKRFGLLRENAVFAHGTHLSESDMDLMVSHGAGVAHCPLSNAYFAGAVFPLRVALEKGLEVGFGSDISGGPSGSIWETARMGISAARILESGVDANTPAETRGTGDQRIDFKEAFFLATRGGADALGLPVGSFEIGMKLDALAIDPTRKEGTVRFWPEDTDLRKLEKMLYTVSKPNIVRVWTDGVRRV
ncbi:amidohydrolase family protein [Celeribacter litoreus]|uniref:amidohydrolase family protein n=1 Tax=Celeribacter litoreus TaxID=2876714 RepID=UPI001CCDAAF2|nr:amidohydrolase family protein [Celeribacter litoreus]MCA0044934.1 amidohydrolase family protein [Celeribacter litoreus]